MGTFTIENGIVTEHAKQLQIVGKYDVIITPKRHLDR